MANNYFELLKDPRWQKKRLEIMEKARFLGVGLSDAGLVFKVGGDE